MFENYYKNKKVLVTGNTGFKGSWLTLWLLNLGAEVYGISKDIPTNPSLFEVLELSKKINHQYADIRDLDPISKFIQDISPDIVFHLAAQSIVSKSYADPIETLSTNFIGTANLLEALRINNKPCNAVLITSDKCYDNVEWIWGYRENDKLGGKDPYSASKGAAEIAIKTYFHSFFKEKKSTIKITSVRAGNVIGGGDWADNRIVPDCFKAWSEKKSVEIRNPNATRPWQHVLEPLSGYLRAGQLINKEKINGESYNFGPNASQNKTVFELLEELSKNWGFEPGFEKFKMQEGNKFHEAGLLKLNCDKALQQLQWEPTLNFFQTAELTSLWYNEFYKNGKGLYTFTENQIADYYKIAKSLNHSWTK